MSNSVQQLCDQFPELIVRARHTGRSFDSIDAPDNFSAQSLVFVSEESSVFDCSLSSPAVIVTNEELDTMFPEQGVCVIVVRDVRMAQSVIKTRYSDYDPSDPEWQARHPAAVIHPSATLGAGVRIGANSVIGENVVIGENTQIRANCVVEHDVVIGRDCIINNLVNVSYACSIGDRVILRPGVIIGNEGFGFAQDKEKRYHRIPHTGTVEVQDDVQIGANCNIDRGTYGKTVIARGVKIDALCHVAHNCFVDEDALFVAQTGIAGSCHIGKRVICSGQTGMIDHRTVADDAMLVHRCGVTEDIPAAGVWAGTPPKPLKEYVRDLNPAKKIEKLARRVAALEAKQANPESD